MPSISTSSKKYNRQNKLSKKTKKNNQSVIAGGGILSITPKTYTNIRYGKSQTNYTTPILTCSQCKHNVFRHHEALHNSRLRAFVLDSDVFDKKYHIFVCNQCGFMMNYSGDIQYNSGTSMRRSAK